MFGESDLRGFGDRRMKRRYQLNLSVRYRLQQDKSVTGSGTTTDLSSRGLAFRATTRLEPGTAVEVWIDWPALRPSAVRAALHGVGRVVRSEDLLIAVEVGQMEFTFALGAEGPRSEAVH